MTAHIVPYLFYNTDGLLPTHKTAQVLLFAREFKNNQRVTKQRDNEDLIVVQNILQLDNAQRYRQKYLKRKKSEDLYQAVKLEMLLWLQSAASLRLLVGLDTDSNDK